MSSQSGTTQAVGGPLLGFSCACCVPPHNPPHKKGSESRSVSRPSVRPCVRPSVSTCVGLQVHTSCRSVRRSVRLSVSHSVSRCGGWSVGVGLQVHTSRRSVRHTSRRSVRPLPLSALIASALHAQAWVSTLYSVVSGPADLGLNSNKLTSTLPTELLLELQQARKHSPHGARV